MLLDWWRRRRGRAEVDPLGTYDRVIEALETEAASVRRSAATLLALQAELRRGAERSARQRQVLQERAREAELQEETRVADVLRQDLVRHDEDAASAGEALQRTEADAQLLVAAAHELEERLRALRAEREDAALRLRAGALVAQAVRLQAERFERRVALEAARDEVERAHALAQLYREERDGLRKPSP
jgi:phage shock protein A